MAKKTVEQAPAAKKDKAPSSAPASAAAGSKAAGKKIAPPKDGAAPNGLQKPLKPSPELATVVGAEPLPRGEVVSKVWAYIKKNDLQNPENKREIVADENLKKVFGKEKVTMFEMNKYLAKHLS